MMREILFRGKDIVGNWYTGNLAIVKHDIHNGAGTIKAGSYISNEFGSPFAYQVRPETVGQFTGLKDRNGKMIFEGDIVKATYDFGPAGEIELIVEVVFGSFGTNLQEWIFKEDGYLPEIIGNIHDQKESNV